MLVYATKQKFGDQVASVGRAVLICRRSYDLAQMGAVPAPLVFVSGVIARIDPEKDEPVILDHSLPAAHALGGYAFEPDPLRAEPGAAPLAVPKDARGTWSWPPRV